MNDKTIIADVKKEYSWIKAHERIIAIMLVLAFFAFLGNKWLNADAAKKDAQYAALEQKLEDQKSINDVNAKKTQAQIQQYQDMVDTLSRQNATLAGAISTRNAQLIQKQEQVKTMPLSQVAQEWEMALNLPQGVLSVLSVAPTSISVPDSVARQTVTQLERVPVLEANLIDQTTVVGNLNKQLEGANGVISTQVTEITGLKGTLVIQDQTCKAEVAKVKADGRRSKRNFFIAGFITGIATRLFLKF